MLQTTRCKGCGADVYFARTETGRVGIYEPAPDEAEKGFELHADGVARYVPLRRARMRLYISHYATCPHSKTFRAKALAAKRRTA